jgi:hypothetical protein
MLLVLTDQERRGRGREVEGLRDPFQASGDCKTEETVSETDRPMEQTLEISMTPTTNPTPQDKGGEMLQNEFEAWMASSNYPEIADIALERLPDGTYKSQLTFAAWQAWQGAHNNMHSTLTEETALLKERVRVLTVELRRRAFQWADPTPNQPDLMLCTVCRTKWYPDHERHADDCVARLHTTPEAGESK